MLVTRCYGPLSIQLSKKLLVKVRDGRISFSKSQPSLITISTLVNGQTKIMVNSVVKLNVTINHITTIITALVAESLGANLILGMD
ncbi:unnamed protein product, partial [Rotaria sp. Silwood2]